MAKNHQSLKNDLTELKQELLENPTKGDSLGQDCYKIRMAISSKNKGKSAGARVITLVRIIDQEITLLTIYDKSKKDTITNIELQEILKNL